MPKPNQAVLVDCVPRPKPVLLLPKSNQVDFDAQTLLINFSHWEFWESLTINLFSHLDEVVLNILVG